jgi:hypothetical protein
VIAKNKNVLVLTLTASGRKFEFQESQHLPTNCAAEFPLECPNDFSGFVDMLRMSDGEMVGIRYYFFEDFKSFASKIDALPGVLVSESFVDVMFTDKPAARSATPNGEQLLGGIHFCFTRENQLSLSFDFGHLSPGCRLHLKEAIESDYRDLDEIDG